MQGLGTLLCALVLVTLTQSLGEQYEVQWRLALLLGAAPMIVAFYFRYSFNVLKCILQKGPFHVLLLPRWKMQETRWGELNPHTEVNQVNVSQEQNILNSRYLLHRTRECRARWRSRV